MHISRVLITEVDDAPSLIAARSVEGPFSDMAARPLHFRSCPNNGHTKSQPFAAQRLNEFSKLDDFLRASAIDSETPTSSPSTAICDLPLNRQGRVGRHATSISEKSEPVPD